MKDILNRFFKLEENGTGIRTELVAGLTTFLTVMYIVPLNGIIMSNAGMPMEAVITATALITLVATVLTGLWANTPIAMSVGLGLNSYVAFALVVGEGIPWQTAIGMVFISGVFFLILTVTNVRRYIVEAISREFKIAISAGIGLFIAFIGLKEMSIIVKHDATLVALGNLGDPSALLGVIGIGILLLLTAWKVRGGFIIGIVVTSIIGFIMGVGKWPESIVSLPADLSPIFLQLDIIGALKVTFIAPIITLMLTDLFDSLGTLSGVGFRAGIFTGDDSVPVQKTLEVDAAATVLGSITGLTTTTSFIESASGVEEGGRTGLTAVTAGLLFLLTLFFLPFFRSIPSSAIYPVLVMVGILMFADIREIDFRSLETGVPAFFIIILMPLTFSITLGLAAGFITHVIIYLALGKVRELNPVIIGLAAVSVLAFVL